MELKRLSKKKKLLPFGLNPAARLPRLTHLTLPALAKLRRAAGHGLYLFFWNVAGWGLLARSGLVVR